MAQPGPSVYKLEDAYLEWPVAPADRAYVTIDGKRLHGYVSEIAAISRRYRDEGHPQYWGRIEGTSADAEFAIRAFSSFGVPTYEGTDRVATAEISRVYQFAPSLGVINVDTYYHSDQESPETVPWSGLGSITRAFAKMIVEVNKLEIKELQSLPALTTTGAGQ
jgi:hypothetical protein